MAMTVWERMSSSSFFEVGDDICDDYDTKRDASGGRSASVSSVIAHAAMFVAGLSVGLLAASK